MTSGSTRRVTRHDNGPHPRESAERCAMRAQLRGDPLAGTAFPAARVLMIEQPGPWGRNAMLQSHFDAGVAKTLLARTDQAGVRVLAIRRPGRTPPGTRRRWAYADTRDGRQVLRWGSFGSDAELVSLPLDGSVGEPDDQPLYLVCTHSKHDACCALRGRPVAAAFDAERPGRVWECSHIGGERFAANMLVLPAGLMYGRVLPFSAPEFVAATEAGEVVGALLRGRIGFPSVAQAALAYAHEHLAVRRVDGLRVLSTSPTVDGMARVRLAGPHGHVVVNVQVSTVAAQGLSCGNPRGGSYLAYQPVAIAAS